MTRARPGIGRLDIALTLAAGALCSVLMIANIQDPDDPALHLSWLALPVFLLVAVPLLWRSVAPVPALGAVTAAVVLHSLLFGNEVVRCGATLPVIWLLAFSASARLGRRDALLGLGLGLAAALATGAWDGNGFGIISLAVPVLLLVWGLGRVAHSRSRIADDLRARTDELAVAREDGARIRVATERATLSHELDGLLARRLGELADMADRGAARSVDGSTQAVLVDIERESRATLDDMRELVGALRGGDEAVAPIAPAPTLTSIEALLLSARGADARLRVDGDPRVLPAGVELSAYRIVEHLLDALRETPCVEVTIGFGPDTLELSVVGAPRRRGEMGAALRRARERVELHRGTLRCSGDTGRTEVVAALPLLVAA